ncbi:MAG: hypothetical protein ACOC80_08700 [Petrotogales bacterium]
MLDSLDKELKKADIFLKKEHLTPSKLLRKSLWRYINEVNQKVNPIRQEKESKKVNLSPKKVNLDQQEKQNQKVNQVNQKVNPIQIVENYEFLEFLKRNDEWLKQRIEHFEKTQDKIISKTDNKEIREISWFRM